MNYPCILSTHTTSIPRLMPPRTPKSEQQLAAPPSWYLPHPWGRRELRSTPVRKGNRFAPLTAAVSEAEGSEEDI